MTQEGTTQRLRTASNRAIAPSAPKAWYGPAKRVLDLAVSVSVLSLGAPLWILIGALIRAEDRGPALYRGRVVGRGGREFTYFKFRTMREGSNAHHHTWLREFVLADKPYRSHEEGDVYKAVDHSRVTRTGRWLRRTGLDEVPQFINVVRGEMSVVGPRPPLTVEYEHYDERARRRLDVKPGITGLYQVTARSRVPFSEMLAIDLDYIRRRSLSLDFWIMLRTVGAIFRGEGS